MSLILITGLSGAGKSLAVNAFEDIGYFCIDNIPASMISKFVEFYLHGDVLNKKIVLVTDIRGNSASEEMEQILKAIKADGVNGKILFIEAQNEVIERRYKETRRMHPISKKNNTPISLALQQEREILSPLYYSADYIIDSSILSTSQFRDKVVSMFSDGESAMSLNVMSFGFKFGTPKDADIVLDVRCLTNPFYIKELKEKTGLNTEVYDYVFGYQEANDLFELQKNMITYALPLYVKEGKSQLTIAFGCTGGKHRSVSFAERLAECCEDIGYKPQVQHRDIERHT